MFTVAIEGQGIITGLDDRGHCIRVICVVFNVMPGELTSAFNKKNPKVEEYALPDGQGHAKTVAIVTQE